MPRDDFDATTKETLAKRVNFRCSNPTCGRGTSGPRDEVGKAVNVGVAAHITAASPGGPRFDVTISAEERRAICNAIWLCQTCAKLVDNDPARYSTATLRDWKLDAEERALAEIVQPGLRRELRVRVGPTRRGRRQLAQFRLYNASDQPIYISGWIAVHGPNHDPIHSFSLETMTGRLPQRILAHDAYEFVVPFDDIDMDLLTELGVEDALRQRWMISNDELQTFRRAAIFNRPPPPCHAGPDDADLSQCKVEISVQTHVVAGQFPRVEIIFKNHGPHHIPVRGAELKWVYDPPRMLSTDGAPGVIETEGAVRVGPGLSSAVVAPGGQHSFPIQQPFLDLLVAVLGPDVRDSGISVSVLGGLQLRWTEEDGIGRAVREAAGAVVAAWDD
jgi:hypothetical protein